MSRFITPESDHFDDDTPLGEVIAWLREQAEGDGANCPACDRHVKIYKRCINSGMARSLVVLYREAGINYAYVPDVVGARSREEGKLAYWGLVEEEKTKRPDGGRAGWWRVTPRGKLFVTGTMRVPKYAFVYNGNVIKTEGEFVSIQDCVREKFNLAELMAAKGKL